MTVNMGTVDRAIRLIVAVALAIWAFATPWASAAILHWLAVIVAVVFAGTALMGNCPLYSVIGIKTCKT